MKNKFEDFCYVCGEVVGEQEGIAEQIPRKLGDPGSGETRWVVRHTTHTQEEIDQSPAIRKIRQNKN